MTDAIAILTAISLQGLEQCRLDQRRLLIVDPTVHGLALELSLKALREGMIKHLLIFDQRQSDFRLEAVLKEPSTSYFTRASPSRALATAIKEIFRSGTRAFDPAVTSRIKRTPDGFRLDPAGFKPSISRLTGRELEVMKILATGRTVKQCAAILGVCESTIDNHKSRLMKKLGIHKSHELVIRAIEDGLMSL